MDIGAQLARLDARLKKVERSSRLSSASLDNAALEVRDDSGTLRARIGIQPDGTAGMTAQNGPPPGAPSAPTVAPSISGLRVTWDGTLADGSALPADFDHIAVYVSTTSGFTPSTATYVGTITRAGDGGMLPVTPLPYATHYVVLVGVNTSGIGGAPSTQASGTPVQVSGPDLTAGSVTAGKIAAGAVQADKLEAILTLATRILAGSPAGARVELNSSGLRAYDAAGNLTVSIDAATGSAAFSGNITGSTMTGSVLQTAASGARVVVTPTPSDPTLTTPATLYYSGLAGELHPAAVYVGNTGGATPQPLLEMAASSMDTSTDNSAALSSLLILAPPKAGAYTGQMMLQTNGFQSGTAHHLGYCTLSGNTSTSSTGTTSHLYLEVADGAQTGNFAGVNLTGSTASLYNKNTQAVLGTSGLTVDGTLTAGNIVTGTVTITPTAINTPTSALVTGLNVKGTTFRGYATANTTVPGTRATATPPGAGVTGVSVSSVTSTGLTVWVNRENLTATTVNWMVIGS